MHDELHSLKENLKIFKEFIRFCGTLSQNYRLLQETITITRLLTFVWIFHHVSRVIT